MGFLILAGLQIRVREGGFIKEERLFNGNPVR